MKTHRKQDTTHLPTSSEYPRTRGSQKSLMTPPHVEIPEQPNHVTAYPGSHGISLSMSVPSPTLSRTATSSSTGAVLRQASEVVYGNTDNWSDCHTQGVAIPHQDTPTKGSLASADEPCSQQENFTIINESKILVEATTLKKRGRKRKNEQNPADLEKEDPSAPKVKRGRGRPPKNPGLINECPECQKIFQSSDLLRLHRRVHSERTHVCEECTKSFHRPYDLKIHSRVHDRRREFECSNCGTRFAKNQTLNFHLQKKACFLRDTYSCTVCQRNYKTPLQLKTHLASHQLPELDITSGLTELVPKDTKVIGPTAAAGTKLRLPSPKKLSRKPEPTTTKTGRKKKPKKIFKCEDCGLILCSKPNLISHVLSCHADPTHLPFECETCGKKFPVQGKLNWHLKVHTGAKPHECTTCKKRFRLKAHLRVHLQTHTGELPFECDFEGCHRSFGQKGHLRSHYRIHTGETPFACKYCVKTYPRADILNRHVKAHHKSLSMDGPDPDANDSI